MPKTSRIAHPAHLGRKAKQTTGTLVEPCSSQCIESQTNSEKKDLQKCTRTSKEARRNERARMNHSKDGRTVGTKQKVGVLWIASSTASYKYSKGGGHN